MSALLDQLSWALAAGGIVLAALVLAVFRRLLPALHVLLDLLLAAGLLRLSADTSWDALAVAAAVVVLRQLLTHGLGALSQTRRRSRSAATSTVTTSSAIDWR